MADPTPQDLERAVHRLESAVVELSARAYRDDYGHVRWPITGPLAGIRRRVNRRRRLRDQLRDEFKGSVEV